MTTLTLSFETRTSASPAEAWAWITSVEGILNEMSPLLRMTVPNGIASLTDLEITAGKPLFRSRLLLFGFVPIGHTDLTIEAIFERQGFVEQSPMTAMSLWRHERRIIAQDSGSTIIDALNFAPSFLPGITRFFVNYCFRHRHKQLSKHLT